MSDSIPPDRSRHAREEHEVLSSGGGDLGLRIESDAAQAVPAFVPEGEIIILMLRPSMLFIGLTSLASICVIALLTMSAAYLARVHPSLPITDNQAFGIGFALMALCVGWQTLDWYGRLYVLTDRRVMQRSGVLRASVLDLPLQRIHHTTMLQSVGERTFRLGTIGYATCDSDLFAARWVMLQRPAEVHRIVREALARYGRRGK